MATTPPSRPAVIAPRGRHAPPIQERVTLQRRRLFEAAAAVFARSGYADASAESISREAGMSKATFYEHFANKEACILALFDEAATEVLHQMAVASANAPTYPEHVAAGTVAFLETLASWREAALTLLVEIIGAGPRAIERRDAILALVAESLYNDNADNAPRYGAPTFASEEEAFACVGATVELASRQLRTGVPADIRELAPTITRFVLGITAQP